MQHPRSVSDFALHVASTPAFFQFRLRSLCCASADLIQGPAATWAEREAAGCALLHLQLGWPLDLYAPHEFLQLYW